MLNLPLKTHTRFISPIFDLYSDYLIVNPNQATARGLAALVEGNVSHDAITRSLSEQTYGSAQLWQVVKPMGRQIQQPDGVLILDDTVEGASQSPDSIPLRSLPGQSYQGYQSTHGPLSQWLKLVACCLSANPQRPTICAA